MAETVEQPNRTAQMAEFISMALGEKSARKAVFLLKEDLERSGISLATTTAEQLVTPAFYAIRDVGGGLHVDWNEGPIMAQTCNWALDDRSSPLSRESSDSLSNARFAWEGNNVEDGFEAFAAWLQQHRNGRTLVNYPTYSDSYFAAIVGTGFADAVVAQLDLVGLPSSVVKGTDLPTPSPVAIIGEVAEVAAGHGFEASSERLGRFHKMLNDDFSLVLTVSPHASYSVGGRWLHLQLGFASHKMNELGRSIMHDERMVEKYPTIGWVASSDDLNECVSVSRTVSEWLDSLVSEFTSDNIAAAFKKATKAKYGEASDAQLLTRLVNHDWPKVCDKNYLKHWDHEVRVARNQNRGRPYTRLVEATVTSVRAYLDEHEIPYGDNR